MHKNLAQFKVGSQKSKVKFTRDRKTKKCGSLWERSSRARLCRWENQCMLS